MENPNRIEGIDNPIGVMAKETNQIMNGPGSKDTRCARAIRKAPETLNFLQDKINERNNVIKKDGEKIGPKTQINLVGGIKLAVENDTEIGV